jgi:hypothetical protein
MKQTLFLIHRGSLHESLEGWESAVVAPAICSACHREVRQIIDYPLLTREHITCTVKTVRGTKAVEWQTLKEQERIARAAGTLRGLLLPLSNLGPWKFKRKSGEPWREVDVHFPDPGGMLWKLELVERCRSAGFEITGKEVEAPTVKGGTARFFHVDTPAFDVFHEKTFTERELVVCETCGEAECDPFSPRVDTFWFRKEKMHDVAPLFVPRTFETLTFLSYEFGKFLTSLKPTGASFQECGVLI